MPFPSLIEIIFLCAIAHVWARATLFAWIRTGNIFCRDPDAKFCRLWRALFDCPLCSGFWIGLLGHLLYGWAPSVVIALGTGSIVGTGALAVYGAIRKM